MFDDFLTTLQRFVRRSPGPLLNAWLVCFAVEYAVAASLTPPQSHATTLEQSGALLALASSPPDLRTLIPLLLALLLASGVRQALIRPARALMIEGKKLTSARQAIAMAIGRLPETFAVDAVGGLILFMPFAVCLWLDVRLTLFVELLASVTLAPLSYLVIARDMKISEALMHAITLGKRHWDLIFILQSGLTLLAMLVNAMLRDDGSALTDLDVLSAVLGYSYLSWIVNTSLFLSIDDAEDTATA